MRPGQTHLNEFELDILEMIAQEVPAIIPFIEKLHVLSREYTGVGSFTNLKPPDSMPEIGKDPVVLDALINMPDVPNGMGAVLFYENGRPIMLETYTFGNDHWEGIYDGYSIEKNT